MSAESSTRTESSTLQLLTTNDDAPLKDGDDRQFSLATLSSANELELIRIPSDAELGRGEFGKVLKASLNVQGKLLDVAVKIYWKTNDHGKDGDSSEADWRKRTVGVTKEAVCFLAWCINPFSSMSIVALVEAAVVVIFKCSWRGGGMCLLCSVIEVLKAWSMSK